LSISFTFFVAEHPFLVWWRTGFFHFSLSKSHIRGYLISVDSRVDISVFCDS